MPTAGPRIEITVDPKGITKTEVIGMQGERCKAASASYDKLFGEVLDTIATSEAYEDQQEIEIKMQQGGSGGK